MGQVSTEIISLEKWLSLAEQSNIVNPFYHPHLLFNAIELYGKSVDLFYQEFDEGEIFFPICGRFYRQAWRYPHCYLGTPLIVGKVNKLDKMTSLLHLAHSDLGLNLAVKSLDEQYSRPIIRNDSCVSLDTYLREFANAARRKTYRKKLEPFRTDGRFETRVYGSDSLPDQGMIERFLELENRGWKGTNKTSLRAKPEDEKFFRRVFGFTNVSHLGSLQVMFNVLYLGKELVAMRTSLILRGEILSFKIAYNEDYSDYSPGLVMELLMIEHFLGSAQYKLLDSCSDNKRPFTDIYRDKRDLLNVTYACDSFSESIARLIALLRRMKRSRSASRDLERVQNIY